MIEITKAECKYLENHGAKWHQDLHRSYSAGHKLYMTESPRMKAMLGNYNKSLKKETHERGI